MPHINEKIDFTVEVFLVYQDTVLLRKHDKYNIWLSIGGHVELDEDPNQAAIREVKEEVGLDIVLESSLKPFEMQTQKYQELIPPYFMNRHRLSETHEHVEMVYFAKAPTDQITETVEREKSSAIKWFTKSEIEANTEINEAIKHYALKALAVLGS